MIVKFGVVALVLVATVSAAPTPVSAAPTTLTITATRSSTATVTVPRRATLDLDAAKVSGGGDIAGFVLEPLSDGPATALLNLRTPDWQPSVTAGGQLEAGRYLLRVAAKSPVRITVPIRGTGSIAWRPRTSLKITEVRPTWPIEQGPSITASSPVSLGANSVALFYLAYRTTGQGDDLAMCVRGDTGACGTGGGDLWMFERTSARTGVAVDSPEGVAVFADRADLRRGNFVAQWQIVSRGIATDPEALAVIFP